MDKQNEYLELPWSIEDTIKNLKELKESLQAIVISKNLNGKGEKDAEEISFNFDRAIGALEKQIPKKPETRADRIRAMTDEELAEKILSTDEAPAYIMPFCKNYGSCTDILDSGETVPDELCKQCLMEWLKSPVEE